MGHPSPPVAPGGARPPRHQPGLRLALALSIGLASGLLCATILARGGAQAGDFTWALRAANDLLAGQEVYRHPVGDDIAPYPLPAAFFALPLAGLAPAAAAGVFFGLSSALLAWCLLREGRLWWLLVFCSWPYCYSLIFAQWPPLIVCMAFLSPLLPLLLVKPQIAIPMLVLQRPSWAGVALLGLVGLTSLALDPDWPFVWLGLLGGYKGAVPPLLSLPLGPLLLLALLRWRDRRAWFFLLLAIMPQRVVYDQLALLLLARTRRDQVLQVGCSWLTLPALLIFPSWQALPGGWQSWILVTLYLPALVVLLRRDEPRLEPEQGAGRVAHDLVPDNRKV